MATTQHYLWAAGHFVLLISSLRYFLAWMLFRSVSSWWYKVSFMGALVSYAIVCQKSLGTPQPNPAWVKRAIVDENMQYFLLAFFWWYSRPIAIALLPYTIFSLFHALTFTRTTLMPQLLPQGPPATAGGPPTPHPLAKKLQVWVKTNYDTAMKAVAFTELLIMARVLVGALTWQVSLISPFVYAQFLRQRYYQSNFTRSAVANVNERVLAYVNREGVPPAFGQVWAGFSQVLSRWVGNVLVPQGAGAGARRQ
ncbi:Tetra-spanning protein 1 [Grifola frondosa]|uniref:Tetra-spanning protein 1 n=1 Tax=Grifola frondosa TaxID=5627 RepID=A0A1C7MS15_GRIFR|nr:Tetra-spanning protein 1 [Grifola frondosa]